MADNVTLPGTGAAVRSDDVGGVQVQVVKVALGADGAEDTLIDSGQQTMANSLPVTLASNQTDVKITLDSETVVLGAGSAAIGKLAANSGVDIGDVDILSIAAGENHIGAIGGNSAEIQVTPTISVVTAFTSGDYVGESATSITFSGAARVNAGTGIITGAILIDYALQAVATELWLFSTAPTAPTCNAAWSISDADCLKCIGVIPFTAWYGSALNCVSPAPNLSIPFKSGAGATTLYGCLVTRGAPTYANGDLTVKLFISQD